MAIHTLYPQLVTLSKDTHQYFDKEGNEYVSFTKLYSLLVDKFDKDRIAGFYGQKHGMSSEDVIKKWDKQRDDGTRIDKAIKLYTQTGQILKEDEELKDAILMVCKKYQNYHRVYDDLVIFNKDRKTAGEIDRISITGKFKDSPFIISDFKRFESDSTKLHEIKGKKWLNPPFDHLPNNKFTKITFQLSYYAHHLEELTGRKCEGAFIDIIEPVMENRKVVKYNNHQQWTTYLKPEITEFFEHFKNKIPTLVLPQEQIINITDEF